ncbi:hypothetical protein CHCC20375_3022 [Bacillus licheniformis]|nr:hypothetical protein CHCC20375_3022 [Bacillus licheniformis]
MPSADSPCISWNRLTAFAVVAPLGENAPYFRLFISAKKLNSLPYPQY